MKRIVTTLVHPPIPDRRFDWQAVFDDYDGAPDAHYPVGHGPTEAAAIADLMQQQEDRCELGRCGHGWCPLHGADHLPTETEYLCDELRVMNLRPSGGIRVVRKKIRSE